jgi:hypothetical protein
VPAKQAFREHRAGKALMSMASPVWCSLDPGRAMLLSAASRPFALYTRTWAS